MRFNFCVLYLLCYSKLEDDLLKSKHVTKTIYYNCYNLHLYKKIQYFCARFPTLHRTAQRNVNNKE